MKKLLVTAVSLCWLLSFEGCQSPAPVPGLAYFFRVYYKSSSGIDLLNPQTKGHFDKDTVKVFDTSNKSGQLTSTPSHINSYESPPCENYVCLYFGDLYYSVQYVITPFKDTEGAFIQIRPTETDTLTYEIIKGSTGFGISKIYYKGQVIWNVGISNKMTIVK